jgi:hypothetical protein
LLQFFFFFSRATSRGGNIGAGLQASNVKGSQHNHKNCLSHVKGPSIVLHLFTERAKCHWRPLKAAKLWPAGLHRIFTDLMFALCGCAEIYGKLEAPAVTLSHQGAPKSWQQFLNWICDFLFLFFCLQNASYDNRKWIFMRRWVSLAAGNGIL